MEKVYEELDEVKAENEKLRADNKSKTELLENLRRVQNEQLTKIQQANSVIQKQSHELDEKTAEISLFRQTNEDLKRSLNEKESILKRVSDAHDKLRANGEDKYRKSEEENRKLMLALDETNEKNIDLEQKINVCRAEIEGLKGLLSASNKKCLEAEKNARASKELRERNDLLIRVEEEKSQVEEKLKWKKEQFQHLEEAHEKLRNLFRTSKKEWEQERSTLLDEISSLQMKLDSQTRISEDLQKKLQMCNNALTQEESRRKHLEVQVFEFKARYEDAFADYQDARSKLDDLAAKRDEEVAALRHSLSMKEAHYKEMEYQNRKLEQENQDLLVSVKELQEAGIEGSGNSSLAKLKNKLRSVEQLHKHCSVNLRAKESEWSAQLEKMVEEVNTYQLQLQSKEATLKEVKLELENCHSFAIETKLRYEEISIMSLVLSKTISEAQSKLADIEHEKNMHEKIGKKRFSLLMEQLEHKDAALAKAQQDIEQEREKAVCLLKRMELLDLVEDQNLQMQKELERYKEMLEESSKWQTQLKEQAKKIENDYEERLEEVCDALDTTNSDLIEERKNVVALTRQVESLAIMEEKRLQAEKDVQKYKEMLDESDDCRIRLEEKLSHLKCDSKEKIRELCGKLDAAHANLAEQAEKNANLMRKTESLDQTETQRQKELGSYKEMAEESAKCQLRLKERALEVESNSKRKLAEASDALEMANRELSEKTSEAHELEFELWVWKSTAERFKADLEQNQNLRKRLEASLLAQVEFGEAVRQERDELAHKLKAVNSARTKTANSYESEKEALLRIMSEKDKILEDLHREVEGLEQESLRRELESAAFEHITAEKKMENVNGSLTGLVEQKEQRIHELEQECESSVKSLSSLLDQKQAEAYMVYQAWEKIVASKILAEVEIEEKKMMIIELEGEISNIRQKVETQERSLSCLRQQASELKAELDMKQNELEEVTSQLHAKLRTSDALIDKLSSEKTNLQEEILSLSSQREYLLCLASELDNEMSRMANDDMKMMRALERIMPFSESGGSAKALRVSREFSPSAKKNSDTIASPRLWKQHESVPEERSPFRLLN